jgi:peptide deformylase
MLQIIYAPNAIFSNKPYLLDKIDEHVKKIAQEMLDAMYLEQAVGLGSNMVGVEFQIIVLDIGKDRKQPYVMLNPEITRYSEEKNIYEEASLSFPGISAQIERPSEIEIRYLDLDGNNHTLYADGFLARVIQHEMDYLHGKTFLDYLSKMKKDLLTTRMLKYIRHNPPHIHGTHCHH